MRGLGGANADDRPTAQVRAARSASTMRLTSAAAAFGRAGVPDWQDRGRRGDSWLYRIALTVCSRRPRYTPTS